MKENENILEIFWGFFFSKGNLQNELIIQQICVKGTMVIREFNINYNPTIHYFDLLILPKFI
jgi:hypothetical protein